MKTKSLIFPLIEAQPLVDPRYGRVWEVAGASTSLQAVGLAHAEVDPGRMLPTHVHRRLSEIYHVVSGTGTMVLNGELHRVTAGDTISLPPGTVHGLYNPGPEPLRLIVATAPVYDPADDCETDPENAPPTSDQSQLNQVP